MTCAKKVVSCFIQTTDGDTFVGLNDCDDPQVECPRLPGEGYNKCKTICKQPGHAEEMALEAAREAGADLTGATCWIQGIGHYCKSCQMQLFAAGVESLRLMK